MACELFSSTCTVYSNCRTDLTPGSSPSTHTRAAISCISTRLVLCLKPLSSNGVKSARTRSEKIGCSMPPASPLKEASNCRRRQSRTRRRCSPRTSLRRQKARVLTAQRYDTKYSIYIRIQQGLIMSGTSSSSGSRRAKPEACRRRF